MDILHLAIPAINIEESVDFYLKLGAKPGRQTPSWGIFDFFGMQLVFHKSENVEKEPTMYPRHFGVIVSHEKLLEYYELAKTERLKFFEDLFLRFPGSFAEHKTFFLLDPGNNLIEFKWYKNSESIFGGVETP